MSKQKLLNYRVSGNGHPVLLLHGFLESNTMWESLISSLSSVKAYCIELPGHGASSSYDGKLSIEKIAEKVAAIIKSENISDFTIIGHSLGGYVGLALLKSISNITFKQLILLNSHPWEDSSTKKEERIQVAKIVTKNKGLFIKQAIPHLFQNPKEHAVAVKDLVAEALQIKASDIAATTLAMRDRPAAVNTITKYNKQVTVIQGEYDNLIPAKKMKAFCKQHNIDFIQISNAGHMIHAEQSEELFTVLNELLLHN